MEPQAFGVLSGSGLISLQQVIIPKTPCDRYSIGIMLSKVNNRLFQCQGVVKVEPINPNPHLFPFYKLLYQLETRGSSREVGVRLVL
jgi:hypothetical protein